MELIVNYDLPRVGSIKQIRNELTKITQDEFEEFLHHIIDAPARLGYLHTDHSWNVDDDIIFRQFVAAVKINKLD